MGKLLSDKTRATLESLAIYLKGSVHFDLWTDHNPLAQEMTMEIRFLTDRIQKFREAIQAYNVKITHVKGVHN